MPTTKSTEEKRLAHEPTAARFVNLTAHGVYLFALDEDGWVWQCNWQAAERLTGERKWTRLGIDRLPVAHDEETSR